MHQGSWSVRWNNSTFFESYSPHASDFKDLNILNTIQEVLHLKEKELRKN